jgi:imidazolonepropionase
VTFRIIEGGREPQPAPGLLVHGASEVATLAGGLRRGSSQEDLAALTADGAAPDQRPAVAAWEGRIVAVGPLGEVVAQLEASGLPVARFARLDARGGTVTPGLVDPHTHLVFAGSRSGEFALRQRGAAYLDILAAGGGILSTVAATRASGDGDLAARGRRWLDEMLGHGVTTIEAKSGYGLDLATELRLIEIAHGLGVEGPVDVVPTFLGAHAVPAEFRERADGTDAYVADVVDVQLPAVAEQGLATSCDVFCERGVFSPEQSRRVLEAGERHGLRPRLHADELAPSGGAELAAELNALSADHLAAPSAAGIDALAAAAEGGRPVVATLLPATTWYLMSDHYAPARQLIERGIPVALATDFNPGTSPIANLALVMSVACLALRMTPAEALAAVTINAAHAVGRGDEIGSLDVGKAADLVVWDVPSATEIPLWPGATLARVVVKRGRVVVDRG